MNTRPLTFDGPDLAHAAMTLLWLAQLDALESPGRDFLNGGRR